MAVGSMILLALTFGFGALDIRPNPKAPSAAHVAVWAPERPDYFLFADTAAFAPNAWSQLVALRKHPIVTGSPQLRANVDSFVSMAEGGLQNVKELSGLDVINDLHWVGVWVSFPASGSPEFLVALGGKFPADFTERTASRFETPTRVVGGSTLLISDDVALGLSASGVLIAGTTRLVEERIVASWKPAPAAPGGLNARLGALLADKPFLAFASDPGDALRNVLAVALADEPWAAELVIGHEYFGLAMHPKGVGWTWVAQDVAGAKVAESVSTGIVELSRAGQLAVRGATRVILAALRGSDDPSVKELLEHHDALLALVLENTSDGTFPAKVVANPKTRTVDVKMTGKSFKHVFPFGILVPIGAGAAFWSFSRDSVSEPETAPAEVLPAEVAPSNTAPAEQ